MAIALFMLGAGCGDVGGEPNPDGSSSDKGPADVIPNDCSADMPEVFPLNRSTEATTGWTWKDVDREYDENFDFKSTFRGVVTLDAPATLPCPKHMDSSHLVCETNKALKLERSQNGTSETYLLVVPVAPSNIALPAEGTELRVIDDRGSLKLKSEQSSTLLLHVGEVGGPPFNEIDPSDPAFAEQLGPFQVEMKADFSNPASATCVTYYYCPGIHRMEPLTVSGDRTVTVEMGAKAQIPAAGGSYDVWNVYSERRNDDYVSNPEDLETGAGGWCAYGLAPRAEVVAVRQSP